MEEGIDARLGDGGELWGLFRNNLPNAAELDRAYGMGITSAAVARAGGLAYFERCQIEGGRFDVDGTSPCFVIGAYEGARLIDLVAFDIGRPDRFGALCGRAALLDAGWLDSFFDAAEPVPVYQTPLAWLRAQCEGVVPINWPIARELLRHRDQLIAEDLEHGREIRRAMRLDPWHGHILVPKRAAA